MGEVTPQPETCATPGDDDCNGMANEGGSGCVCAPGAVTTCYDGPAATLDVGTCKGGMRTCNALGTAFGPCLGEVLPAVDLCQTPEDEDCNGAAMPCVNATLWSKRFGGNGDQSAASLAVGTGGEILLGGTFQGSMSFDGFALVSAGNNDVFLTKLNANGNHLWSKSFGGPAGQSAVAVATDASGNMIFTGTGGGTFDFGLGNIPGTGEIFLVKLDAAGNTLWAKRFGVPGKGQIAGTVKTDALGNIVIGGQFDGSLDFGGGALVSMGGEDIFVAKLSPGGDHLWSKSFGSVLSSQRCASVAIDAAGNIVLTGQFLGTINFGGAALVATNMNSTQNIFLAKLDAGGNHLWSKGFGDAAQQYGQAVAFGAGGSILVTGGAEGSTDFGGGALGSVGSRDIFVARFDANGNHVKSQLVGSPGDESGQAIAPDGVGGLFVTGSFSGTINFGNGNLNSAGGYDIFLARLAP